MRRWIRLNWPLVLIGTYLVTLLSISTWDAMNRNVVKVMSWGQVFECRPVTK